MKIKKSRTYYQYGSMIQKNYLRKFSYPQAASAQN